MKTSVFSFCSVAFALLSSASRADEAYHSKYAKVAGLHLGRVEAAAGGCVNIRVNEKRRAEIRDIYSDRKVHAEFEGHRKKAYSGRVAAMAKGSKERDRVCRVMLDAYGAKGLVIRGYLVRSGEEPLADTPGVDRGYATSFRDLDPEAAEAVKVMLDAGTATAIETVCDEYEMAPLMQGLIADVREKAGDPNQLLVLLAGATAAAAKQYDLEGRRHDFCERILRDYGPASDTPVVRVKRAK
ncbi:MAG: hypothetical protein ACOYLQ_09355 [Hyphomicrobiaceae bacterium]